MLKVSLSLSALFACCSFLGALTTEVDFSFLPVPEEATRAEIRVTNSSGTLAAGNVQYQSVENGFQSEPAIWLKKSAGWERISIPDISVRGGFHTFSAISGGFQEWLVGRAWSGSKIEGYAYNYVSGQTVWGGSLQEDLVSSTASRFTGVSADGLLFCGSANRNGQFGAPVLFDRTGAGLEEVAVAEGFEGGWLYDLAGSIDAPTGVGFLYKTNPDSTLPLEFPARWTREEGLVPLPALAEGKEGSVLKISPDGTTAFGLAVNAEDVQLPTIWHLDQGGQPEALPLPEGEGYRYGEADSMDPASGWISGSVYFDENLDDEIPGYWKAVVWSTARVPQLAAVFLKNRYGVDFGGLNIRASDWFTAGGGIFGSYTDEAGGILPFIVGLRGRAAGFEFLQPMPGGSYYAEARGISNDGSRIAGISSGYPSGTIAATWTAQGGWEHLPAAPNARYTPYFLPASDISPDGQFIVGRSPSDTGTPVGFVWNNGSSSFHRLTDEEGTLSRLTGISNDGTVAVGQSAIPGSLSRQAMVVRNGVASVLSYPAEAVNSWAYDVSGDGQVAAGWATFADNSSIPVAWTVATGNHQVLPMPPGAVAVDVLSINEDGSIIGGAAYYNVNGAFLPRPTYWANGNPVLIPTIPGFQFGSIWSMNAEGTLLVGQMLNEDDSDSRGFIHQTGIGTTTDLHGWYLNEKKVYLDEDYRPSVLYISANGRWFCGSGPDPLVTDSRIAFRIKVPEKTALDSFGSDTVVIGGTDFVETWFGLVMDGRYPLVHHQQHGWLYMSVWGPDGGYYYDTILGWVYVERGSYPLMQLLPSDGTSRWVYYDTSRVNPRVFYDYATQSWLTEDEL